MDRNGIFGQIAETGQKAVRRKEKYVRAGISPLIHVLTTKKWRGEVFTKCWGSVCSTLPLTQTLYTSAFQTIAGKCYIFLVFLNYPTMKGHTTETKTPIKQGSHLLHNLSTTCA